MKSISTINIDTAQKGSISQPVVMWPSSERTSRDLCHSLSQFPPPYEYRRRYSEKNIQPISDFIEEIENARKRIWIVDEYLFKASGDEIETGVNKVMDWFWRCSGSPEIKIATMCFAHPERVEIETLANRAIDNINANREYSDYLSFGIKYSLCKGRFQYLHDRFAVIDDEMWHFGATVGGIHNKISAISRGWDADDHGAIDFFNELWGWD